MSGSRWPRTLASGGVVFFSVLALALQVRGQHVAWRIDQPVDGPFGHHLATIGDKDGDGYDDVVTTVYVPIGTSTSRGPEIRFVSGHTGRPLGRGRMIYNLATAGDVDGDGIGDYCCTFWGQALPLCQGRYCVGVETRSGRTDAVIWSTHVRDYVDMGHMFIGDLDLDGDGCPDVIVGTNGDGPVGGNRNGVLCALGGQGQLLWEIGCDPGEAFAPGLGRFIDFDGDGCDDFLLGIYEPTGRGAVDIRSGRDGSRIRRVFGVPPVIWGHGATAAMIGDCDGDGVPDIVSGDSGPFSPGVIQVLGSVTGNLIHRFQANASGGDDFGWPDIVTLDVDRDGIDDVIANTWRGPLANAGCYAYSGRDGSLIRRLAATNPEGLSGRLLAMPPQSGEMFRSFLSRGGDNVNRVQCLFRITCNPPGVVAVGDAGSGTLASQPRIGVRQLDPRGFRISLSGVESSAPAFLVLGFSRPAVPYFDLPSLGFVGCTLVPYPDLIGFSLAAGGPLPSGYAAFDFRQTLLPAPVPGQGSFVYAQWVTLGSGPTWPGGVSEAIRCVVR